MPVDLAEQWLLDNRKFKDIPLQEMNKLLAAGGGSLQKQWHDDIDIGAITMLVVKHTFHEGEEATSSSSSALTGTKCTRVD